VPVTCQACSDEIKGAPVLVPKFPRGSVAYCSKVACVKSATRRAAVAWPAMRKRHPRPAS
jgi:hypothetical protein